MTSKTKITSENIIGWATMAQTLWQRDHALCRKAMRNRVGHVGYCAEAVERKLKALYHAEQVKEKAAGV